MSDGRVKSENARISYEMQIIRFLGDGEAVAFGYAPRGHSGPGWYAWNESYPASTGPGSSFVGRDAGDAGLVTVLRAILAAEVSP